MAGNPSAALSYMGLGQSVNVGLTNHCSHTDRSLPKRSDVANGKCRYEICTFISAYSNMTGDTVVYVFIFIVSL